MTTNPVDAPRADGASPHVPTSKPAAPASPARLLILLGLLAVVIGVYAYDFLVAKPGVTAAYEKLQAFVDDENKRSVKDSAALTPDAIQKQLGMQPTSRTVNEKDGYEVEYYRWWGHVPLLNTRRHYISVVYLGQGTRKHTSHYLNENPPDEALPITMQPGDAEGITLGQPDKVGPGESDPPAAADAPAAADTPASAEPPAKADEPPAKADEPAKADPASDSKE